MSEKTEPPTPKKERDARKKGQVANSKEVVAAALMISLFGYFFAAWGMLMERLQELLVFPPQFYEMSFNAAIKYVFDIIIRMTTIMLAPIIMIVIVVAIMSNVVQVGVMFAFESLKPSLDKINPASGIKKIVSIKNLVENLKSIFKVLFLSILLMIIIHQAVGPLIRAPACGLPCLEAVLGEMLKKTAIFTSAAFIIVAGFDFMFQKAQHIKSLKMTKDEVKREYKESEGDPTIKGKRKQLAQELLMSDQTQAVRKSSVVVTNPIHLAIGIRYDREVTPLPMVVAKGRGLVARNLVAIAREEDIPVMENIQLAHALYNDVEIDRYIPRELIEPVAQVLRWVQKLERQRAEGDGGMVAETPPITMLERGH